jgi:hypothetical protein
MIGRGERGWGRGGRLRRGGEGRGLLAGGDVSGVSSAGGG